MQLDVGDGFITEMSVPPMPASSRMQRPNADAAAPSVGHTTEGRGRLDHLTQSKHRQRSEPVTQVKDHDRASDVAARLPDGAIMILLAVLGACVTIAVADLRTVLGVTTSPAVRLWCWAGAAWSLAASVAVLTHQFNTQRFPARSVFRWVSGLGIGIILITAIVMVARGEQPAEHAEVAGTATPAQKDVPTQTVTSAQRNAIATFAKSHGKHDIRIVAGGTADAIVFGDSLADAFEAGGWIVDGRRTDATRAVMSRLGPVLPQEPDVGVAPQSGIGGEVKRVLEAIRIHPANWTPIGRYANEPVVWIARPPSLARHLK